MTDNLEKFFACLLALVIVVTVPIWGFAALCVAVFDRARKWAR